MRAFTPLRVSTRASAAASPFALSADSDRAHHVLRVVRQEVAHAPRALPSVDAFDVLVGRLRLAEEVLHARRIVVAVLGRPSLDPPFGDPERPRRHESTALPAVLAAFGRGGLGMSVAVALGGLAAGDLLERFWISGGTVGSADVPGVLTPPAGAGAGSLRYPATIGTRTTSATRTPRRSPPSGTSPPQASPNLEYVLTTTSRPPPPTTDAGSLAFLLCQRPVLIRAPRRSRA